MSIKYFSFIISTLSLTSLLAFGDSHVDTVTKEQATLACEAMVSNAQCPQQQKALNTGIIGSLKLACAAKQKANGCDELRAEITQNSGTEEASKKMLSCDSKAVCKQDIDWVALRGKCIEGIRNFGKEAMEKIMKAGDAIVASNIESAKCDKNEGDRKQKLYDNYNQTVPDFLKIYPPPGRWLDQATCGEILAKIRGLSQVIMTDYNSKMNRIEQQNPLGKNDLSKYKDPKLLAYKNWLTENAKKDSEEMRAKIKAFQQAFSAVPAMLKSFNVRVDCYTPETKAEIACYAGAAAVATVVSGGVSAASTKALMLLARSSGSLKVAKAVMAIEKLDKTEAKLDKLEKDSDRATQLAKSAQEGSKQAAQLAKKAEQASQKAAKVADKVDEQTDKVHKIMDSMRGEKGEVQRQQLVRALGMVAKKTPAEQNRILKAVVDAHNVCADSGFKEYSPDCLRKKAKILKEAGLNQSEREYLMRRGIAGQYADVPAAASTNIRQAAKVLFGRDLTTQEITAIWDVAGVGSNEEKARRLSAAGFSPTEIEKIISGELRKAGESPAAKAVVINAPPPSAAVNQAPPPASAPTLTPQANLDEQFLVQNGQKLQAAFDESRKAHLEEIKQNPDLYRKSPSKVIEASTSGLNPKESADLIEAYVKDTNRGEAELMKVVDSIDRKTAAEKAKDTVQSTFNQYKLQQLKVELLERHYTQKYMNKFKEIDWDLFYDKDEAGFDAFKAAEQSLETLQKKGAGLRWPK